MHIRDHALQRGDLKPAEKQVPARSARDNLVQVLSEHRWSAMLGGCFGGSCEWHRGDAPNEQLLHAEHVADVVISHQEGTL